MSSEMLNSIIGVGNSPDGYHFFSMMVPVCNSCVSVSWFPTGWF